MTDHLINTLNEMNRFASQALPGYVEHDGVLYHLRPTKQGITAVSTSHATPQMGFNIDHWQGLERITWSPLADEPGRDTPEKQVQAFLLRTALKNGRLLPTELAPPGCTLWFLVDELVVQKQDGAGASRRGDLIAVCEDANGHIRPAFIELKSVRESTALQKQVHVMHEAFYDPSASLDRLAALHRFAVTVLSPVRPGKLPAWSTQAKRSVGVMVWPHTDSPRRQTPDQVEHCADIELRVVGYAGAFSFAHEVPSGR